MFIVEKSMRVLRKSKYTFLQYMYILAANYFRDFLLSLVILKKA